jgi:hypothetical protein
MESKSVLYLLTLVMLTGAENEVENDKFNFLVFAQIWPITSCDIWESRSEANTCFLPKESTFFALSIVYPNICFFKFIWPIGQAFS